LRFGLVWGLEGVTMAKQFKAGALSFQYPENWALEKDEAESGWTVSVQSPETAFVLVTCDEEHPSPDQMAAAALEALRSEYPELEADPRVETLAGQMAVGHDIEFFSFDLTNTVWTRSFEGDDGTYLVMCQGNDLEMDKNGPVLRAICASMRVEE
jgi:hypothetical protein